MSGCSLTDAFPDITDKSGKIARKEERKKAKSCGGPALSFLKATDPGMEGYSDPDRIAKRPDAPPEPEGKELVGNRIHDIIGKSSTDFASPLIASSSVSSASASASSGPQKPAENTSYFGKSDMDGYADFNPTLTDNPGYQIQGAGFGSFDKKGLEKATGQQLLPIPSLNSVWKPLTPGGAQTSFFDATYNQDFSKVTETLTKEEKQAILKKLDILFARLDDMENRRNEYAHTEVSLFILSGLFLLFGLETLRKLR
jgi:hypothetical protein